jgi:hypothetical protein
MEKAHRIQIGITLGALLIAAIHVWFPTIAIDAVTVTLVLAAMVPWLAPLFKKLKLPGGWEIEFQELQQAKERVEKAGLLTAAPPGLAEPVRHSFQIVAEEDPNLALAGLRIEIERRIVQIAAANGVDTTRRSARALLHALTERRIITHEQQSALSDMLGVLNQAVHGATVPRDAADWAMQIGPNLLRTLDAHIPESYRRT